MKALSLKIFSLLILLSCSADPIDPVGIWDTTISGEPGIFEFKSDKTWTFDGSLSDYSGGWSASDDQLTLTGDVSPDPQTHTATRSGTELKLTRESAIIIMTLRP